MPVWSSILISFAPVWLEPPRGSRAPFEQLKVGDRWCEIRTINGSYLRGSRSESGSMSLLCLLLVFFKGWPSIIRVTLTSPFDDLSMRNKRSNPGTRPKRSVAKPEFQRTWVRHNSRYASTSSTLAWPVLASREQTIRADGEAPFGVFRGLQIPRITNHINREEASK